jgi:hypothetical protein
MGVGDREGVQQRRLHRGIARPSLPLLRGLRAVTERNAGGSWKRQAANGVCSTP